jgi:hypothetical protein
MSISNSNQALTDESFCERHQQEWRRFSVSYIEVSMDQQCEGKRRDLHRSPDNGGYE